MKIVDGEKVYTFNTAKEGFDIVVKLYFYSEVTLGEFMNSLILQDTNLEVAGEIYTLLREWDNDVN